MIHPKLCTVDSVDSSEKMKFHFTGSVYSVLPSVVLEVLLWKFKEN